MLIARQKRKENIAEYILYIWQLEDLLRALQFSPEAIYTQLVAKQQVDEQTKQDIFLWYMEIANLLRSEGKDANGHLEHTTHLISDLNELHKALLKLPSGEEYRQVCVSLLPELPTLKSKMERDQEISDIEVCFRALYSVILYRIKGSEGSAQVDDVLTLISPVIAKLASIHKGIEDGKFDLYKETKP